MARTLIEKYDFFFDNDIDDDFDDDIDVDVDDGVDNVVEGLRGGGGGLGFLRAQTREARTPIGVRQYFNTFSKPLCKIYNIITMFARVLVYPNVDHILQ
jgi:hypothetical protein